MIAFSCHDATSALLVPCAVNTPRVPHAANEPWRTPGEHPAKLSGVLRTANWLYAVPRQFGGGNEPYAVAVRSTQEG